MQLSMAGEKMTRRQQSSGKLAMVVVGVSLLLVRSAFENLGVTTKYYSNHRRSIEAPSAAAAATTTTINTSPEATSTFDYKGIILLSATQDRFGIASVLGSSALFRHLGWFPVVIMNTDPAAHADGIKTKRNDTDGNPRLQAWVRRHDLCVIRMGYPESGEASDKENVVRYQRLLAAPRLSELVAQSNHCSLYNVPESTFVTLGDADLWPINDISNVALKSALQHSESSDALALGGTHVQDFPWKRRALCYTGATIRGWKRYLQPSEDVHQDYQRQLAVGQALRKTLDADWLRKTPVWHMDEYILNHDVFVTQTHPVVESSYYPRRIGKHFNATWIYNATIVVDKMWQYDDVHLGHTLKPKPLMDAVLETALSAEEIHDYWDIVNSF